MWPFNKNEEKKRGENRVARTAFRKYKSKYEKGGREIAIYEEKPGKKVEQNNTLIDRSRHLKEFFAAVTRYIPAGKSAVWTWKNLCMSNARIVYTGGSDKQKEMAAKEIEMLGKRIFPIKTSKGNGFDKLLSAWLTGIFRYGRFAGKIELMPGLNGIEKFKILDAFKVYFEKDTYDAYYAEDGFEAVEQNKNTFYYYGLDSDSENPYGIALVEAATKLMQIVNEMFNDMRLSSSNAGTPRLHIKITQPEIMEDENLKDYTERCNNYFGDTVDGMAELAADDNIYTWGDVEIKTVGGENSQGFVWKQNLQSVQEELISAYHLFPWIMGKQFGTTRNWVAAQFDVLMQMVQTMQMEGAAFIDWICNTHLALCGLAEVKVTREMQPPRDIAARDMAMAEKTRLENTEKKMKLGFMEVKQAAREHGYEIVEKKE